MTLEAGAANSMLSRAVDIYKAEVSPGLYLFAHINEKLNISWPASRLFAMAVEICSAKCSQCVCHINYAQHANLGENICEIVTSGSLSSKSSINSSNNIYMLKLSSIEYVRTLQRDARVLTER